MVEEGLTTPRGRLTAAEQVVVDPEPVTSDQVREPATEHATVDYAREHEGLEENPAHCTTAEGEHPQESEDLINFDMDSDMPCLLPSSEPHIYPEPSICPEPSVCLEISVCPELSACPVTTMEVVSLSAVLLLLGVTIWCVWAAHTIPENPGAHKFPPTLLPPPPLSPGSPSAHPQPTICAV